MSRSLITGLPRRTDDPLAPLAAAALRSSSASNRLHDSSAISLTVDALRAIGVDPLDASEAELDAVLPVGTRMRTRAWRPFARLLRAAEARNVLGPRGRQLLARMSAGPTGRRNRLAAYRAYTAALGSDAETAPAEIRERFLALLDAAGTSPAELAATREAIRRAERSAIGAGARTEHLPRTERLIRALLAAGAAGEAEALDLIAAIHAGYAPSVHRWADAVAARYLAYCADAHIPAFSTNSGDLVRFARERGDALGLGPVRRLIAAAHCGGLAPCAGAVPVEPPLHDRPDH
jgi:hypothetical protein